MGKNLASNMQTENIWKVFPNSYSNLTLKLLFPTFIWIRIWNFFFGFLIKKCFELDSNPEKKPPIWIGIRIHKTNFEFKSGKKSRTKLQTWIQILIQKQNFEFKFVIRLYLTGFHTFWRFDILPVILSLIFIPCFLKFLFWCKHY